MNIKQTILLIFTIIFIVLSASFIVFETMEIPKDQNAVIDTILEKISKEVKSGKLSNSTLEQLPANYFYAIWVENNDESWIPLIVDSNTSINASDGPTFIPSEYSWSARSYLKTVNEITFMVWINKYNSEFYIKNIILVALFLLLFYLILVLVISLLFFDNNNYSQNDFSDDYDEESIADEDVDKQIDDDLAKTQIMTEEERAQNVDNTIKNKPLEQGNKQQFDNNQIVENEQSETKEENIEKTFVEEEKQSVMMEVADNQNIEKEQIEVEESIQKNEVNQNQLEETPITIEQQEQEVHSDIEQKEDESQIKNVEDEFEDDESELEEEECNFVYEHNIAGDEIKSVKFTDAEYDALTQPLDFSDCSDEEDDDFFFEEENQTKWKDLDLPKQAQMKHDALVDGYKRLWTKTIKMSDSFKANFSFKDIKSLWRLGLSSKEYLQSALAIGLNYFGWDECCIYLKQGDNFFNIVTNDELLESNIDIPTKGTKKGPMYIPLFFYGQQDLCGYLYFKWSKIDDFKLTDIMYYLKFIFSKECEFIFDYLLQETINTSVEECVQKKGEATFAVIVVDNKDKIEHDQDEVCVEQLDKAIYKKMKKHFKKFDIYSISPLKFAIIGHKLQKEKVMRIFEKWISARDKHVYSVAALQNVALSFSCGVAFKSDNVDNLASGKNLIERAENLLRVSINDGGNKISVM